MSTTQMSLETLQFLLQHMDANRRFEVSRRCPSLREFEKSIPLKIDSLVFMKHLVTVNDTTYQIGVVRKYNVGETPKRVEWENKTGGVRYEVDRYGIEDESDATTKTPGDVEMKGMLLLNDGMRGQDERQIRRLLRQRIRNEEARLANRLERRPSANQDGVAQIQENIEAYRAKLFAYNCRRYQTPTSIEHFVQITTWERAEMWDQKSFERYVHNKKYSEAVKQLTTVLFGGRSCPIYVKEMKFKCRKGIIRLPVDVKYHVERLGFFTSVGETLQELAPIIHESSYPLKELTIHMPKIEDVTNPIVRSAELLKARMFVIVDLEVLSRITNPKVHVRSMLIERNLEMIIGNWIELNRAVGTEYIFDFLGELRYLDEMEEILKCFNGVPIDDENVIFAMNDAAQLRVSYGRFPEYAPLVKYAVRFLTEAIEH